MEVINSTLNDEDILQAIGEYIRRQRNLSFRHAKIEVNWKLGKDKVLGCTSKLIITKEESQQ